MKFLLDVNPSSCIGRITTGRKLPGDAAVTRLTWQALPSVARAVGSRRAESD
jgi:hypothetical protein